MKKRLLSWLLVLCMVLAMLPMSAFAADEESPAEPSAQEEVIDIPEETPEVSEAPEEEPEETPEASEEPEETPAEEPEETPEASPEAEPEDAPEDGLDLIEDPDEPEVPEEEPETIEDEPDEPEELELGLADSGTCGTSLTWELNTDGVLTISGTGAMTDWGNGVSVPWEVYKNEETSAYPVQEVVINGGVTSIGSRAFDSCTCLTKITIPSSVTSIGEKAFYKCTALTAAEIPGSVTSIGDDAFNGCTGMTSAKISNGAASLSLGIRVFDGCSSLASFVVPSSISVIPLCTFYECSNLASVTIPGSVTSIGESAFNGCSELTSVTIPDSVTSIGESAFLNCESLASLTISGGMTVIAPYAFSYCTALTAVVIPNGVTTIGDSSFRGCSSLTSVTIPSSVTTIDAGAFEDCYGLTSITIPNSVTSISEYAFSYCWELSSVTIPSSVTSIAADAFCDCGSLEDVYYGGSSADQKKITIAEGNDPLTDAVWHHTQLSNSTTSLSKTQMTYTGSALKPTVTVKDGTMELKAGTDYTVAYTNNVNVGTATVTVTGKGHYTGTKTAHFKITAKSIIGLTVTLDYTSATYTGSALTPSVTLKDGSTPIASSNYAVAYSSNVNPGVATVTITGKGNYADTITKTFTIAPKATSISSLTNTASGIKVKWSKVSKATGYYVYRGSKLVKTITSPSTVTFTDTGANTSGTKYTYKVYAYTKADDGTIIKSAASAVKRWYYVSKPVISSVKSSTAGKATVKWGAVTGKSGYEIQYSTSASFASAKTKTVTVTSKTTKTISSLTKGKKYYFRVRAYKKVSGVKAYSAWSAKKSVTVKK